MPGIRARSVRIHVFGGPEVLRIEEVLVDAPGAGEVRLNIHAIGLNRTETKEEIRKTIADFGIAAKNAMEAGFDGVQIQASFLYLIAQFVNSATNHRTDEYGGSTANRTRFLFEITETVLEHVEADRVGIKVGRCTCPVHLLQTPTRFPIWNTCSVSSTTTTLHTCS